MDNFKKNINLRIKSILIFDILAFALIIFMSWNKDNFSRFISISDYQRGMITGFQIGLFIGLQVIIIILLLKYIRACKNPKKLETLYISEHDERKKLIKSNTFSLSHITTLILLFLGAIISGYFNITIFKTLIGVLYIMLLITCVFKVYFSKKY